MNEANEKRLIASEIIRQLYEAGERSQIELLKISCDRALELLDERT